MAFPALGKDYIEWFCVGVNLPAALNPDEVNTLFKRAAYRPEILGAPADALRFAFALNAEDLPQRFTEAVLDQIEALDTQTLRVIHALTPLQSAVLRVLAEQADQYSPFEDATIAAYQAVSNRLAPQETVRADISNVQQALIALQVKALVWKEKRGVYALEDRTLADLLKAV